MDFFALNVPGWRGVLVSGGAVAVLVRRFWTPVLALPGTQGVENPWGEW